MESEQNLVQVVTIHKSKGLEYDIIFVPFVSSFRASKEAIYYDPELKKSRFDLDNNDEGKAESEKERLAEDLRLLYVAVTRAVYTCYMGLGALKDGNKRALSTHLSAIGYLLIGDEPQSADALTARLHELEDKYPSIKVCEPPQWDDSLYTPVAKDSEQVEAQQLTGSIDRSWRMTSYSGLASAGKHSHSSSAFLSGEIDIDAAEDKELIPALTEKSMFNFPRGARPGTFLHTLFEEVEFTQSAFDESNKNIIEKLLIDEQLEPEWLPILQGMVDTVLATDLDGNGLILNGLKPAQRLVEMEFLLPIESLTAEGFHRITSEYDELTTKASSLGFNRVQGMLKALST
ncbi:exodeoxyribonuclease V beta chain [Vibrio ishigakensis]|uniref:Exodeoxyribonuclease V beta chain n=1 Tax=Vibrio ishigakensis TaxID=1481914 RepID=A0A0B8PQS8_9VIBR|nr:exodeoxyribonuclease V beta chain [Vibrio ishigakensis]